MKNQFIFFSTISLIAVIVYFDALNHDFTQLDDQVQITENKSIRSLEIESIQAIFQSTTVGMYQPLTTLLNAVIYQFSSINPVGYRISSLILHLLNCFLVFKLLRYFKINPMISYLAVSLFAFHPMQVESIVWASALSNLLAGFFSLWSILMYIRFRENGKKIDYVKCFLLFVLACLSKSSAVVIPLIFILFDLYPSGKIRSIRLLNKLPLFLVSVLFGLITLLSRESAGHLSDLSQNFTLAEHLLISIYALLFYPFKFLFPFNLSVFYPFPDAGEALPISFYLALVALLLLTYLIIRNRNKTLLWMGSLFFLIPLLPVIQLIPIGNQLTTDRYIYLPMIGLLLIIAHFLQAFKLSNRQLGFLFIFPLLLAFKSHERTTIWENDQLIWEDVLSHYPEVAQAHNNLGSFLMQRGKNQQALEHINRAISLKPYYADAYANRGNLKSTGGDSKGALADFSKAIELRPHANAYFNRANELVKLNQFDSAIRDYGQSIELQPNADVYTNRAYTYIQLKDFKKAKNDLNHAIEINPTFDRAYFVLGIALHQENNREAACRAFQQAVNLGNTNAKGAFEKLCR